MLGSRVWLGRHEGSSANYEGVLAAGGGRHCRGSNNHFFPAPLTDHNRLLCTNIPRLDPRVQFRVKARDRALGGEGWW
jgi:hypothetical protein